MRCFVLALLCALNLNVFALDANWTNPSGTQWTTGSNWSGGIPPNGSGDGATFTLDNTYPLVVNIDTVANPITLGTLTIDLTQSTSTNFNIINNQLDFNTPSGNPSCVVTNPSNTICAIDSDLSLLKPLDINLPVRGLAPQDLLITGEFIGTSGITLSGQGTLRLQGTVQYDIGTATIFGGTLLLDKSPGQHSFTNGLIHVQGGTVRSLQFGQIASSARIRVDSGTFDMGGFDQDANFLIYNGGSFLTGGGTLLLGSPTNALTMRNTALNATLIVSSTTTILFDATNGGTASISGTLDLSGGTPTFNIENGLNSTDMFIDSILSNGGLIKTGEGTLELAGANTYAGTTTVNQGTLLVSGSIGGTTVDVNGGGTLNVSGTGTVTATTTNINTGGLLTGTGTVGNTNNSGTVSPGNGIGTLNVAGAYTQSSGGNLQIEVNHTLGTDLLSITGAAFLDGTVTVLPEPGIYLAGQRYQFINYGSFMGALGLVDNSGLGFSIALNPSFGELINLSSGAVLPIARRQLSGNAFAVADYLFCRDFFPDNGDLLHVMLSLVSLPADQFAQDLVKLSPIQFGALPLVNLETHRLVSDVIVENTEKFFWCDPCVSSQEDQPSCEQKETSVWIAPIGNYYHQDGITHGSSQSWSDRQIPLNAYSVGVGLGASHLFFQSLSVGGGIGYTYSHIDWEKNRGDGHWNSIYIGPSIGWSKNNGYLNFLLLGSFNRYHIDRKIKFPGVNRTAESAHNSYDLLLRLDGGYKFRIHTGGKLDHFFILPEATVSYLNVFEESFNESGAGSINLDVDRKYSAFLQPAVLVKFLRDFYRPGYCITPAFQIGWISNVPLSSGNYTSRFYQQNTCQSHFVVKSFHDTTNQMTIGGELVIRTDSNWIIELGYKADLFDNRSVQSGKVKVEKRF